MGLGEVWVSLNDREGSWMSLLIDRGIPGEFPGFLDPSLNDECFITILSSSTEIVVLIVR